ncbi:MAG: hypothetical protein ACRENE_10620 [Polyangiaceae bacterium]
MATNIPNKNNRTDVLGALQKLSEGFTKHAAAVPQIIVAGASMTESDVVAKLQARIAIAKTVQTTHATWQAAVKADRDAIPVYKAFLASARQTIGAAFAGQVDVLADFGMTPRKVAVITPQTRAAAALKAKATRVARGTTSKKQKASVKGDVTITPTTATPNKPPATAPSATVPTATAAPVDHPVTTSSSSAQAAPVPVPAAPAAQPATPVASPASPVASPAAPTAPPAASPPPAVPAVPATPATHS